MYNAFGTISRAYCMYSHYHEKYKDIHFYSSVKGIVTSLFLSKISEMIQRKNCQKGNGWLFNIMKHCLVTNEATMSRRTSRSF
jgi:hypothetical protein